MSGGEALDLALGLLRAPARRGLLVARPLPAGMTTLLEVAGGSTTAANAASQATGALPEELLEAARFFVQQVLFHEGASAYRILGARPGAPQSQLLQHHRLLQRWLHPDRDGGQAWDSAFSARVNEAWSRVRTPHARRAYDATLSAQGRASVPWPGQAGGDPVALVPARHIPPPPASAARSIAGPLAVLGVTAACLGLLWLAQHRDTGAPEPAARPRVPAAPQARPATPDPLALIAGAAQALDPPPAGQHQDPAPPAGRSGAADARPAPTRADENSALDAEVRARAPLATGANLRGHQEEPSSDDHPGGGPGLQAGSPLMADAQPDPPSPDLESFAGVDPFQLLQEAERTAAQAAAYLASDGSHIPPIWNDFSTEVAAAEARARLALRRTAPARMDLVSPQWRMGADRAGLDAGYRLDTRGTAEEGRLRLEMTRREERWLVTRLSLESTR